MSNFLFNPDSFIKGTFPKIGLSPHGLSQSEAPCLTSAEQPLVSGWQGSLLIRRGSSPDLGIVERPSAHFVNRGSGPQPCSHAVTLTVNGKRQASA
jgi:hypothetical protein